MKLGITMDYIGRDEALLLRSIMLDFPEELGDKSELLSSIPNSTAILYDTFKTTDEIDALIPYIDLDNFVGIVASDTSIDRLYFEIIQEKDLEEGRLVEVSIKGQPVLYQVINGLTKEEIVYQKNTFGYARAKAQKIGKWDNVKRRFIPVKWIPQLNAPVFLKTIDNCQPEKNTVGHFPGTSYTVGIKNIHELVTHNTAILGILGIGKSMLSIELIERMIAEKIKVVCLDLTNQYAKELADFYNEEAERVKIQMIQEAGQKDKDNWDDNPEQGGSIPNFCKAIFNDLKEFLENANSYLKIYNPAQLFATKQLSEPRSYQYGGQWNRGAALWTLTPVEITRIISEQLLELCQDQMTDKARVCLVLEEAHSLVPELNAVASERDKAATNGTARVILQGRKFGLGCLLITQRTANVTKTILNQCNTIFAMRTFDDTGKSFLSNFIGSDYADVLPSLQNDMQYFVEKHQLVRTPF